jgi:hypothetical protein
MGNIGARRSAATVSTSGSALGVDMGTLGGILTLAAMDLDPSTTTLAIGNSSSSAAGILQLNGAVTFGTTSPITNSIIRANNAVTTSSATSTIQSAVGAGTQTLGLRLGTANGAIITAGSKTLVLAVPLTELSPGSGFRKVGGGVLILQSPATLAGGTVSFEAGTLRITSTDALGGASGPVIRFNAGIGTATLGVGFNGELANAIDVPTGLVQQQLIQTSAAGTPTLSGTMTINYNTQILPQPIVGHPDGERHGQQRRLWGDRVVRDADGGKRDRQRPLVGARGARVRLDWNRLDGLVFHQWPEDAFRWIEASRVRRRCSLGGCGWPTRRQQVRARSCRWRGAR